MKHKLYRQYGLLLDDILNYFGVLQNRGKAKKELHKELKNLYGVDSLKDLTEDGMRLFLLQIHVIFSTELGIELNKAGEYKDIRRMSMKKLLRDTNDKFKKQGQQLREKA